MSPAGKLGRLAWRLETPAWLGAMFVIAFLLRVLIAPHVGFYGDLQLFQRWAGRLDAVGPGSFYVKGQFADYPPGYLYVLWATGKISATPDYLLLKLPSILADLGLAWICGTFAARLAPASVKERWPVRALVAAAALFNPAVLALGAVWGQVDAVTAMFVLGTLLILFTSPPTLRYEIPALLVFAVAIAMKPQSGFVLPVILYTLYRRHVHRRRGAEALGGALRIALAGGISLGLWAVSGLAFGLGPVELVRFYGDSASVYPYTSANAFNLWGAVGFWRADATGDGVVTVLGIPALRFGMLLFLVATGYVLWRAHRAIDRGAHEARVLTVASATLALVAYVVLTRMHERYMFVALAALAPLIFVRPLRLAYAALSALFVLNLWYPFTYFNAQWRTSGLPVNDFHYDPWFTWLLGGFATDTWQKTVWSLAVTAIGAAIALRGVTWVAGSVATATPPASFGLQPAVEAEPEATGPRSHPPSGTISRSGPLVLVALACVFGLATLRGETSKAANLNDSAFHLQMVRWAGGQIREGRVPLDGWYPYLSFGSSFFHHYQSLPHTLTAYIARATGMGDQTAYVWILYLLLALWPIAVYAGARLLGLGRWAAAAAAAVSPLIVSAPGYGYEHGSYTWQGYGVYSQLWGMWLLPLAWGLTWRAVTRGTYYATAVLALALTMACHFITGYLAVLTLAVWVLAPGVVGLGRRVVRAAIVALGAVLVASWALVPLVGDTKWTTQSTFYVGTIFNDSYGAHRVLGWLFSGKLFDAERFPTVSVLFVVGLVVCGVAARRDSRARALLGVLTLSIVLFFGRPTLGPALNLLPGLRDIQIHRFVMGVHLAGILIAGVGLGWLIREAAARVARLAAPRNRVLVVASITVVAAVALLAPAWTNIARYDRHGAGLINVQRLNDATDGRDLDRLVAIVRARGDGRVYAGLRANWGKQYVVGFVPVYAWLADRRVDTLGFTFRTIASLSTDVEAAFDETSATQHEMFNIHYLILPADHKPSVPAKLIASSGRHRLWEVATTGYTQVVDRAEAIAADRTNLQQATVAFRRSDLASRGIYPGIAFAGGEAPAPTFSGAKPVSAPPGRVLRQGATPADGIFTATVVANRPSVALLKSSYDPRWTATVDGRSVKPVMMAPSLVGVDVPAGRHDVRFAYRPYGRYPLLLGVGLITLLGLATWPRRSSLRGRRTDVPARARDETAR